MEKNKVSIIEDDEVTAMNLQISLEKLGYEIISHFDNAIKASVDLPSNLPDILLIDISLQEGNDGILLAEELSKNCHIPFIYLTSHVDDEIIEQAKHTNPYGYIVKPFHANSLHASIQMALFQFESQNKSQTAENTTDVVKTLHNRSYNKKTILFEKEYIFNLETEELFYNTQPIALNQKEKEFFKLLLANLGSVVFDEDIIKHILTNTGEKVSIRSLVWRIKNKLPTEIIHLHEDRGYYLEA